MTDQYKKHIDQMILDRIYAGPIINNSHRGDIVEMMVLDALGTDWKLVGLGWHPWDLQKGTRKSRVRIQVKNCALLQIWGQTELTRVSVWLEKESTKLLSARQSRRSY